MRSAGGAVPQFSQEVVISVVSYTVGGTPWRLLTPMHSSAVIAADDIQTSFVRRHHHMTAHRRTRVLSVGASGRIRENVRDASQPPTGLWSLLHLCLANVKSRSRSLHVIVRPSVVLLSVCNVRAPYSGD